MARNKTLIGFGSAISAVALVATSVGSAYADYAPSGADAVGVGSDTVQHIGNFLADGDASGDTGYNSAGNTNKMVSFDAVPDGNGRAAYAFGGTGTTPLNPTIPLRAGLNPWLRPNGSANGIAALIADKDRNIDFVRSSRLPRSTEYSSAANAQGVGAIRAIKVASDSLQAAVATTSNAPATVTQADMANIFDCTYKTWNQIPGNAGGSTATIEPLVPQSGSGTSGSFATDMVAAKSTYVLGNNCGTTQPVPVEEHDPSVINNPNRIAPFSAARLNLYLGRSNVTVNGSPFSFGPYFYNPAQVYGTSSRTVATANVKLVVGAGSYNVVRGLYIVVREADGVSGAAFQPGGSASKVQDLFYSTAPGAVPFAKSDAGQVAIAAGGATPAYLVCNVNQSSGC